MPTEHLFIDIYSFTLLRVSFLLRIVELRLSTFNKPISDLSWSVLTTHVTVYICYAELKSYLLSNHGAKRPGGELTNGQNIH